MTEFNLVNCFFEEAFAKVTEEIKKYYNCYRSHIFKNTFRGAFGKQAKDYSQIEKNKSCGCF